MYRLFFYLPPPHHLSFPSSPPFFLLSISFSFSVSSTVLPHYYYVFLFFQCVPFWPVQSDKKKKCVVKVKDKAAESKPFCFVEPHTTLLRVDNEYGGINVECQVRMRRMVG